MIKEFGKTGDEYLPLPCQNISESITEVVGEPIFGI
jgi:hypothetical protein